MPQASSESCSTNAIRHACTRRRKVLRRSWQCNFLHRPETSYFRWLFRVLCLHLVCSIVLCLNLHIVWPGARRVSPSVFTACCRRSLKSQWLRLSHKLGRFLASRITRAVSFVNSCPCPIHHTSSYATSFFPSTRANLLHLLLLGANVDLGWASHGLLRRRRARVPNHSITVVGRYVYK